MTNFRGGLFLMSLVLIAGSSVWALQAPVVNMPREGDALGPNYEIGGYMPYKAFLVVLTDVITAQGELLRTVPGIRHWTNDDGSFRFRVASPRVSIGDKKTVVWYRIRVFELGPNGEKGPERVINCRMAP